MMFVSFTALSVALALAAAPTSPEPAPNPAVAFLRAADVNDFRAMDAALDPGSAGFLKIINNCYLRRVFSDDLKHEVIAAWMCAEGPNRSRVVLATVALTQGDKVVVSVQQNTTHDRPAPERAGSAFGP
jgi:hypothetical protein